MQGSVIYQDILQEGLQKGRQEGLQKGRQESRQEEGRSIILRLLNLKLGVISAEQKAQIAQLSLEQLESLGKRC